MIDNTALLRTIVKRFPAVVAHLNPETIAALKAADLDSIRADYHDAITEALVTYLEGGNVAGPRNKFKREMVQAFGDAFGMGWEDGGQELPFDGEALDWYNDRVEQEMGFIDGLFADAKQLRKDENFDILGWASARADGYTGTIAGIYNAGVLWAKKNQMLMWNLGSTEKHCSSCISLNGNWHRASWYIQHDYIPRKPGANLDCHGDNCDCFITDKNGEEVSL